MADQLRQCRLAAAGVQIHHMGSARFGGRVPAHHRIKWIYLEADAAQETTGKHTKPCPLAFICGPIPLLSRQHHGPVVPLGHCIIVNITTAGGPLVALAELRWPVSSAAVTGACLKYHSLDEFVCPFRLMHDDVHMKASRLLSWRIGRLMASEQAYNGAPSWRDNKRSNLSSSPMCLLAY